MRYIMSICYDGERYAGFQKQNNQLTIQETIENAISKVTGQMIPIIASGRTDAGVSAFEQICHIDCDFEIKERGFLGHINSLLPKDIRVKSLRLVDNDFHARYTAKKKTYEYLFYCGKERNPIYDKIASHVGYDIDINTMKESCKYFIGEHDFTSFCASNTSVIDKVRTIYDMYIKEIDDNFYKLVITGNGFLYNMVRIIMGTLLDVGMGKKTCEDIKKILLALDRSQAGKTAEAKGLYLKKVEY